MKSFSRALCYARLREDRYVQCATGRNGGRVTMTTMTIKGPATLQDLLNTPKDGNKHELVDGEIVVSPAGMRHSEVAINIGGLIWEFLQKNPIGKVYASDVGIAFPNGNVRSPDVTYVSIAK